MHTLLQNKKETFIEEELLDYDEYIRKYLIDLLY